MRARNSFKPGQPKPVNSGRRRGTPNKNTQMLIKKANDLGCDPFEVLLLFAKSDWQTLGYKSADAIPPQLRAQCAKEAAQYMYPKRKAIELSAEGDLDLTIRVKPFDIEERKAQLTAIDGAAGEGEGADESA